MKTIYIIEATSSKGRQKRSWYSGMVFTKLDDAASWIDKRPLRDHISYEILTFKSGEMAEIAELGR